MPIIDEQTFQRLQQQARRDDWHMTLVGSDVRVMLAEIEQLKEALVEITDPTLTSDERVKVARGALGWPT